VELSESRRKSTREMVEEDTQTEPSVPPRAPKNRPYDDDDDDDKPRRSKTDKHRHKHDQQTQSPSRKNLSLRNTLPPLLLHLVNSSDMTAMTSDIQNHCKASSFAGLSKRVSRVKTAEPIEMPTAR